MRIVHVQWDGSGDWLLVEFSDGVKFRVHATWFYLHALRAIDDDRERLPIPQEVKP